MKPYQANLINAGVLLVFGLWAYMTMAAESRSMTVLIPMFFGVAFLLLTPQLKKENRIVAHVVAGLTLLILVALMMPLKGSIGRADMDAIFRVSIMMAASLFALVIYIRSFIALRRKRQEAT